MTQTPHATQRKVKKAKTTIKNQITKKKTYSYLDFIIQGIKLNKLLTNGNS